jgi:CheY-like chemotaxis protein
MSSPTVLVLDDEPAVARVLGALLAQAGYRAVVETDGERRITGVRVLILGVVREHRRRGIEAAMVARTVRAAMARGYRSGELSWILESNGPMRRLLERLGARVDKTYRVYEKAI